MKKQEILWTVLPNGISNGNLQLSVFVSPRLFTDEGLPVPHLDQFPDFQQGPGQNWAQKVATLKFVIELEGGSTHQAVRVSPNPDVGLWSKLFKDDTFVRPYEFPQLHTRAIRSFPVRNVVEFIRATYQTIAEFAPEDYPDVAGQADNPNASLRDLLAKLGDIYEGPEKQRDPSRDTSRDQIPFVTKRDELLRDLDALLAESRVIDQNAGHFGFASQTEFDFLQMSRFYLRPEEREPYGPVNIAAIRPKPKVPKTDFHQVLSSLGDYPSVLRALGIVIDLEVPLSNAIPNTSGMRLTPPWTQGNAPVAFHADVFPWTKYERSNSAFFARPEPGTNEVKRGMARINDDSEYYLVQSVDADSAGMKTLDFAANMRQLYKRRSYIVPDNAALPSLHSGGLSVMKNNRAYRLHQHFQRMATMQTNVQNNQKLELWAGDLLRGYRIDVREKIESIWHSLCARIGNYTIEDQTLPIDDEGYVKSASSSTSSDAPNADIYVHESLYGWDGWSLVAERPQQNLEPDPGVATNTRKEMVGGKLQDVTKQRPTQAEKIKPRKPNRTPNDTHPDFGYTLEEDIRVKPGTLPRMRFGKEYQLRARTVDLAGNSVPLSWPDSAFATNTVRYGRFEPVVAPAIVLREVVAEGESLETMAIRSNYNQTAVEYAEWAANNITYASGKPGTYSPVNDRHCAPPKQSQQISEFHGEFDVPDGSALRQDFDATWEIAKREKGTFKDLASPPVVSNDPFNPHVEISKSGDTLIVFNSKSKTEYVLHQEDQLVLPYLPDPVARGAAFRGLPKVAPGDVFKVAFDGAWPDRLPFRIELVEGDGAPAFDANTRVLTIPLPKAHIVKVRFSCYIGQGDIDEMGIWQWLLDKYKSNPANFGAKNALIQLILKGMHWMITPYRELVLVHAVQQPLLEPEFYKLQLGKPGIGSTYAILSDSIRISARSTSKVDVMGEWEDPDDVPSDDINNPETYRVPKSARAFEASIEGAPEYKYNENTAQHDFYQMKDNEEYRHQFGDTKYHRVSYFMIAATRFREFFPQEIWKYPEKISRNGPVVEMDVPNSARPDAPKVLYIVPTFGWEEQQWDEDATKEIISRRCGGGLRVYLDRPWYSSGDGELLGVVMRDSLGSGPPKGNKDNVGPNNTIQPKFKAGDVKGGLKNTITKIAANFLGEPDPELKPYLTQWGRDPIWGSENPKSGPVPSQFPLAVKAQGGLTLEELAGKQVAVAGHVPHFDEERRLWYCDIEIDMGDSYFPFVRLALARYHPISIPNAHLSRVILADFAQIAPDRVAAVSFLSDRRIRVMVSGVYGVNYLTGAGVKPNDKSTYEKLKLSRVLVADVETRATDGDDDLGWVPYKDNSDASVEFGLGVSIQLEPFQQHGATMIWMGEYEFAEPTKRMGGTKLFRLVLKEYEVFRTDRDQPHIKYRDTFVSMRMVYADKIEI